ncbi:cell wall elongation regulator TseB-like domain-containing protein [Paenibacillus xylaniclasticus]|uniref:cell wall elongation regulator TseB-like domain-containing protein n=1 Tax=Paenibacillus xylaniclasticus TaxID=588083 RepID=UPI000FDBAB67|nr:MULTISPECIES: DUF5590 domain-containing protein [Paenibacillus]
MTPRRWTALSLVLLLAIIAGINIWYQSIFKDTWSEEKQAKNRAIEAASLTEIDRLSKFVWDETAWVVEGTREDGEQVFVWLRESVTDTVYASRSVSKDQIRLTMESKKPDARIEHIRPGIAGGEHIWEVYYSRIEGGQRKYMYDFYSFENGTLIDTFKLPAKRLAEQ